MRNETRPARALTAPLILALAGALAAPLLLPTGAAACGGCFAPTGSPTVVTRHQMAVSLSPEETTLWDQIEYAGAPEDFVWVLPVRDAARIELADNAFFQALELATGITMEGFFSPPGSFCPDPCGGGVRAGTTFDASERGGMGPRSEVTVHYRDTIGPYETVTIGSEDPEALVRWLDENGYEVPPSIYPTIEHYVSEGMDFAALRLAPGAGVNEMQPVRVTMPGMSPVFPLRMVAAGVEDKVGLELFIFSEGRYEAANFTNSEVDRTRIAWDWDAGNFTYDELWEEAAREDAGRAWVTEYAQASPGGIIRGYSEVSSGGGSAMEDYDIAVRYLPSPYLTRMTADLAARYLGEDLILQASFGEDLSPYIWVDRERNRPPEPTCSTICDDPSRQVVVDPIGPAGGAFSGGAVGDGCSVRPRGLAGEGGAPAFLLGLLAAAALIRASRRRR